MTLRQMNQRIESDKRGCTVHSVQFLFNEFFRISYILVYLCAMETTIQFRDFFSPKMELNIKRL